MNNEASVIFSTARALATRRGAWRAGAAALALAVAGLAAGVSQAQPAPTPPGPSAPGMGGPMGGPMHEGRGHRHGGPGRHMERLLERVDATPQQRTQIRGIFEAAAADMRAQHDARHQLHEQGLALLSQPTIDAAAVERLRQQMVAQHDQASQRWSKAMVEAAGVLTPAQRTQLAQLMREHAGRGPDGWRR